MERILHAVNWRIIDDIKKGRMSTCKKPKYTSKILFFFLRMVKNKYRLP